jgi:hypothetical protein
MDEASVGESSGSGDEEEEASADDSDTDVAPPRTCLNGLPAEYCAAVVQGSISQNSISAENFSDKFSSSNVGQNTALKQYTYINLSIVENNLGF